MAPAGAPALCVDCSLETHTWIQKAADLSGLGTDAVRWVAVDAHRRMDVGALERQIRDDQAAGRLPFLVVGTAGSVSTGAVDPLHEIAALCRAHKLWFHVDGAYGAPAVAAREAPPELRAMADADSIAVDPHKWLYAPLEAGCALVRDPAHLRAAFSYTPVYYHFESGDAAPPPNYYEYGPQNSRGFRALKVWMTLQQVGRRGYEAMIGEDIRLSRRLFELVSRPTPRSRPSPRVSASRRSATCRRDRFCRSRRSTTLNQRLLDRLIASGRAYVSNAVLDGRFLLRSCIVNFRTSEADLEELVRAVVDIGHALHAHDGTTAQHEGS